MAFFSDICLFQQEPPGILTPQTLSRTWAEQLKSAYYGHSEERACCLRPGAVWGELFESQPAPVCVILAPSVSWMPALFFCLHQKYNSSHRSEQRASSHYLLDLELTKSGPHPIKLAGESLSMSTPKEAHLQMVQGEGIVWDQALFRRIALFQALLSPMSHYLIRFLHPLQPSPSC